MFKASLMIVWILGLAGLFYLSNYVTIESAVHFIWFVAATGLWNSVISAFIPKVSE